LTRVERAPRPPPAAQFNRVNWTDHPDAFAASTGEARRSRPSMR
jgi:hypothetical protein